MSEIKYSKNRSAFTRAYLGKFVIVSFGESKSTTMWGLIFFFGLLQFGWQTSSMLEGHTMEQLSVRLWRLQFSIGVGVWPSLSQLSSLRRSTESGDPS